MKRIPIVILSTALLIGAFLFFDTCSNSVQPFVPDKKQIKETEKKVSSIDEQYKAVNAFRKIQSDSLKKVLKKTDLKLQKVIRGFNQSKQVITALVKKDTAKASIAEKLNDCNSLKENVVLFTTLADSSLIIYDNSRIQMGNLLAIKDSEIVICASSYTQLKNVVDENLERERKLTKELETAYKQQRKKNIQNKFLGAGFLIMSVVSTTLYISAIK